MDFDNVRVGGSLNGMLGVDEQKNEDECDTRKNIPLPLRIKSNNWGDRASAYDEAKTVLEKNETIEISQTELVQMILEICPKAVVESIPAAQEKGIEMASALVYKLRGEQALHFAENIIPIILLKGLGKSQEKGLELFYRLCEECGTGVVNCVLEFVKKIFKTAKGVILKQLTLSLLILRQLLLHFGPEVVSLKACIPIVSHTVLSTDRNVREESYLLLCDFLLWTNAFSVLTKDMPPPQVQELQKRWDQASKEPPVILRTLHNHQAPAPIASSSQPSLPSHPSLPPVDPLSLLEEVDVIAKLPPKWSTLVLANDTKWSLRRDNVQILLQLLEQHPKLSLKRDYKDVVSVFQKVLKKEPNLVVLSLSLRCVSLLQLSLRRHFSAYTRSLLPFLVQKLKEKNKVCSTELLKTLENALYSVPLEVLLEELQSFLVEEKSPQVKTAVVKFWRDLLERSPVFSSCINPTVTSPEYVKRSYLLLTKFVEEYLQNASKEVRDCAAGCYVALLNRLEREDAINCCSNLSVSVLRFLESELNKVFGKNAQDFMSKTKIGERVEKGDKGDKIEKPKERSGTVPRRPPVPKPPTGKTGREPSPLPGRNPRDPTPLARNKRDQTPLEKAKRDPTPLNKGRREPTPLDRGRRDSLLPEKGRRDPTPLDRGRRDPTPLDRGRRDPTPLDRGRRAPTPLERAKGLERGDRRREASPCVTRFSGKDKAFTPLSHHQDSSNRSHSHLISPSSLIPPPIPNTRLDKVEFPSTEKPPKGRLSTLSISETTIPPVCHLNENVISLAQYSVSGSSQHDPIASMATEILCDYSQTPVASRSRRDAHSTPSLPDQYRIISPHPTFLAASHLDQVEKQNKSLSSLSSSILSSPSSPSPPQDDPSISREVTSLLLHHFPLELFHSKYPPPGKVLLQGLKEVHRLLSEDPSLCDSALSPLLALLQKLFPFLYSKDILEWDTPRTLLASLTIKIVSSSKKIGLLSKEQIQKTLQVLIKALGTLLLFQNPNRETVVELQAAIRKFVEFSNRLYSLSVLFHFLLFDQQLHVAIITKLIQKMSKWVLVSVSDTAEEPLLKNLLAEGVEVFVSAWYVARHVMQARGEKGEGLTYMKEGLRHVSPVVFDCIQELFSGVLLMRREFAVSVLHQIIKQDYKEHQKLLLDFIDLCYVRVRQLCPANIIGSDAMISHVSGRLFVDLIRIATDHATRTDSPQDSVLDCLRKARREIEFVKKYSRRSTSPCELRTLMHQKLNDLQLKDIYHYWKKHVDDSLLLNDYSELSRASNALSSLCNVR